MKKLNCMRCSSFNGSFWWIYGPCIRRSSEKARHHGRLHGCPPYKLKCLALCPPRMIQSTDMQGSWDALLVNSNFRFQMLMVFFCYKEASEILSSGNKTPSEGSWAFRLIMKMMQGQNEH